jgi:hypothetical protein
MKEIITRWDGNDYIEFVKGYANYRAGQVGKDGKDWITLTGAEQVINSTAWKEIIETVKFEFRHDDLVLNKSLPVKFWVDNVPQTIIHLSHIFNYDPVATFVPLKHRLYNENLLIKKLKDYAPDAHVIIVGRSCSGFTDKVTGHIDIQDLIRPTWHMNGDWDGC